MSVTRIGTSTCRLGHGLDVESVTAIPQLKVLLCNETAYCAVLLCLLACPTLPNALHLTIPL